MKKFLEYWAIVRGGMCPNCHGDLRMSNTSDKTYICKKCGKKYTRRGWYILYDFLTLALMMIGYFCIGIDHMVWLAVYLIGLLVVLNLALIVLYRKFNLLPLEEVKEEKQEKKEIETKK